MCLPKLSATETAFVKSICSCSEKLCSLGSKVLGSAGADHAGGEGDHVLLVGVGTGERPFEGEGPIGVIDGDEHATAFDLQAFAADVALVLELEVLFHLPGGKLLALGVQVFRDGEDGEED